MNRRAFSLLEGLVAASLLLLAIRFCLNPLTQVARSASASERRQQGMEVAQSWSDNLTFAEASPADLQVNRTWVSQGQEMSCSYRVLRQVVQVSPRLKQIQVEVSWGLGPDTRKIRLETQLFRLEETSS